MKMNKTSILFYISLLIISAVFVLSVFSSSNIMETVKTLGFSIPLAFYFYNVGNNDNRRKTVILLLSALIYSALAFIEAFVIDNAPLRAVAVYAVSSLFYLLPLTAVTFRRGRAAILSAIHLAVTLPALKSTVGTYMYLYRSVPDYPPYLTYSTLLALTLILTVVSELLFNTKRNYLSRSILFAAFCLSVLSASKEGMEYPLLSPVPLIIILILFIYMARGGRERYTPEVRRIVLTSMETQEIKHLRRKKKPRVYEIPPNVPVNDIMDDGE